MKKIIFIITVVFSISLYSQEDNYGGTPVTEGVTLIKRENTSEASLGTNSTRSLITPTPGIPTGASQEVGVTNGELSVSLSGAANYTIPLAVPPGINGVQPNLSLSYNSQSGIGLAGYGWNISGASKITLCASNKNLDGHNGIIHTNTNYYKINSADRFELDGQRLVMKNGSSGFYGSAGTVYETENFSNIEVSIQDLVEYSTYKSYFIVNYPDGSKAYYGANDNSRDIIEWGITYFENPQGLRINYEYTKYGGSIYLSKITYGSIGTTQPTNIIEFLYIDSPIRLSTSYGPEHNFRVYQKEKTLSEIRIKSNGIGFKNYYLTHDVVSSSYHRLLSITEKSGDNTKSLNPTIFSYETTDESYTYNSNVANAWSNIGYMNTAQISGDFDADGKMDFIIYGTYGVDQKKNYALYSDITGTGTNIGLTHNTGLFESIFTTTLLSSASTTSGNDYKLIPSQGWCVVQTNPSSLLTTFKIYTKTGSAITPISNQYNVNYQFPQYNHIHSCNGSTSQFKIYKDYYNGDFNGDGLSDVIAIEKTMIIGGCNTTTTYPGGKSYYVNLDRRITSNNVSIIDTTLPITNTSKIYVADFTGEGTSDLLIFDVGIVRVYSYSQITNKLGLVESYSNSEINPNKPILIGDYNGDGRADFIIPGNYGTSTYNLFTSAGYEIIHNSRTYPVPNNQSWYDNSCAESFHIIPSDFNADGLTDLIYVVNDGCTQATINIEYFQNVGGNFVSTMTASTGYSAQIGKFALPIFLNLDRPNSGSDLSFITKNSILSFRSSKSNAVDTRLRAVTLGNGLQHKIAYTSLSRTDTNGYSSVYTPAPLTETYPTYDILSSPSFKVVSQLEKISSGENSKQLFKYYGAVANNDGIGFIGFRATSKTNWFSSPSQILTTISRYDISKRGLLSEQILVAGEQISNMVAFYGPYITKESFTHNMAILPNKVFKSSVTSSILHNSIEGTYREMISSYDEYNNPLLVQNKYKLGTNEQKLVATLFEYDNQPTGTNYIIGRLKKKKTETSVDTQQMNSEITYTYDSNQLINQIKSKGHNTDYITEDFTHDIYGNIISKTISAPEVPSRRSNYEYDPSGRFLIKSIMPDALFSTLTYDFNNGNVTSITDIYGLTTSYDYDTWGRKNKVTNNQGKAVSYAYTNINTNQVEITEDGEDGSSSIVILDDLGRPVIKAVKNIDASWSVIKTKYDIYGQITSVSEPYGSVSGSPTQESTTSYDIYGRVTQAISYTYKTTNITYTGLTSTSSDGFKTVSTTKNSYGLVSSVTDNGGTINYQYYPNGNIKQSDYEGIVTIVEQDGWGRKTKLVDPSAGEYTYEYNNFGEVTKETNPKGFKEYTYDIYGKLIQKSQSDETSHDLTEYTYDSKGRLNSETFNSDNGNMSFMHYQFNLNNNLEYWIEEFQTQDCYNILRKDFLYDDFGRAIKETALITFNLDLGQTETITKRTYKNGYHWQTLNDNNEILWENTEVNARGSLTKGLFGNGVTVTNTYGYYGYLSFISHDKTNTATNVFASYIVTEPMRGNVTERTNYNFYWDESFQYDQLDRLTSYTNVAGLKESQTYDNKGRITGNGQGTYEYQDQDKPYQQTSTQLSEKGVANYKKREGIFNDSMEDNKGWATYYYSPGLITYDQSQSHSGEQSIKLHNNTNNEIIAFSEVYTPINNSVDTEYVYSAWVYTDGARGEMFLYMKQNLDDPFTYDGIDINIPVGEWTYIEKTFLVPANIKYLSLRLDNNDSGDIWYDDVKIVKTNDIDSARMLQVDYNMHKLPLDIRERGIERLSFEYNTHNSRAAMYYGSYDDEKLLRPYRKYYLDNGRVEMKYNVVDESVEFFYYVDGDGYNANVVFHKKGATEEYLYLHRDHQGSIVAITNQAGEVIEQRHFDAWGNIIRVQDKNHNNLDGLTILDRGYTGHEHLQGVDLINMNGRIYDPYIHRFLQPDNFVQDPYNTQNYNRYSYVLNNPLKYIDINGEEYGDGNPPSDTPNHDWQYSTYGSLAASLYYVIKDWDELGIKDFFNDNVSNGFKTGWTNTRDWGRNQIETPLKNVKNWFNGIKSLFSSEGQKTVYTTPPQASNFQGGEGWQDNGFKAVTSSGQKYGGDGSGSVMDWLHRVVYEIDQYNPIALAWDGIEGHVSGSDRFGNQMDGFDSSMKIASAIPIGKYASVLRTVTTKNSLGAGRTAVKNYLQNVQNLSRQELVRDLELAGFKRVSPLGSPSIHYQRGGIKIRLDARDANTPFNHMHINYGGNKNAYDIFLNPVNYKSEAAHIKIQ